MIEAGALIAKDGSVIHWHLPPGRSGGYLPDDRNLWDIIWENRDRLLGFAHTHPWHGEAHPSGTDLSTFAAIELALGKSLTWWVVTLDRIAYYEFDGQSQAYEGGHTPDEPHWVARLRELSQPRATRPHGEFFDVDDQQYMRAEVIEVTPSGLTFLAGQKTVTVAGPVQDYAVGQSIWLTMKNGNINFQAGDPEAV